jgi:hypothetical protein
VDWPEASTFHSVYAETGEAVDALLVTNSLGARAYVQAKLRLDLSEDAESPLGSALGQFVDQRLSDSLPRRTTVSSWRPDPTAVGRYEMYSRAS